MRELILGSDGFLGSNVATHLAKTNEVFLGTRRNSNAPNSVFVDMLNQESILKALEEIKPEVVINCVGVVDNTESANLNVVMTKNVLEAIVASQIKLVRIVLTGSAAEYGIVEPEDLPIKETHALNPVGNYAISKKQEIEEGLEFAKRNNLPVVVARIFNPLGRGMHNKFLTSRIIGQLEEIKKGDRTTVEVFRLDSDRDYVDIRDVAEAYRVLSEGSGSHEIYNIGSGQQTSNEKIIRGLIKSMRFIDNPEIIQTSDEPEALVACQADISRMKTDFGWAPEYKIEETLDGLVYATR